MGSFEAFYASDIQHPILLWLAALAGGLFCAWRSGLDARVRRFGLGLTVLSLLDAWLTSAEVYGIGVLSGASARFVPLFFVLAGDFRYLLLVTTATAAGGISPSPSRIAAAAGLTVIVPIFSQTVLWALPESISSSRVLFLVYELSFMVLTAALMLRSPQIRSVPWLLPVSRFVLLYYGLWAAADAIILATGSDLGFGLRVVPNLLYYGGLIAVIGWAAPVASRASRS